MYNFGLSECNGYTILAFPSAIGLKCHKEIDKFINSIYTDEVTHNEPPHLGICCLPFSL